MSRPIRSDAVYYGRNVDIELDDYVRCARCGFPCKLSRDQHAPRGSRLGWGIRYDGAYLDVTFEGGAIIDIGTTPGSSTQGITTEEGIVLTTEDGQILIPE